MERQSNIYVIMCHDFDYKETEPIGYVGNEEEAKRIVEQIKKERGQRECFKEWYYRSAKLWES